jgi:hypothetical protein
VHHRDRVLDLRLHVSTGLCGFDGLLDGFERLLLGLAGGDGSSSYASHLDASRWFLASIGSSFEFLQLLMGLLQQRQGLGGVPRFVKQIDDLLDFGSLRGGNDGSVSQKSGDTEEDEGIGFLQTGQ